MLGPRALALAWPSPPRLQTALPHVDERARGQGVPFPGRADPELGGKTGPGSPARAPSRFYLPPLPPFHPGVSKRLVRAAFLGRFSLSAADEKQRASCRGRGPGEGAAGPSLHTASPTQTPGFKSYSPISAEECGRGRAGNETLLCSEGRPLPAWAAGPSLKCGRLR